MNQTIQHRRREWFFARNRMRANREKVSRLFRKKTPPKRRPLFAESLEPRVLFSAAPVEAQPAEEQDLPVDEAAQTREVTAEDIARLGDEAKERWIDSGLTDEQIEALDEIEYVIADLAGGILGAAEMEVITIDIDAAGEGWFIDATEWDDEEFVLDDSGVMRGQMEGVDLLSVLMHETGHILGIEDEYAAGEEADVMFGLFTEGERREITDYRGEGVEALSLEGIHYANADTTGNWEDPTIWSNGTEPDANEDVAIRSGATVTVTQTGELANEVEVGDNGGDGTLVIAAGADLTTDAGFDIADSAGSNGTLIVDGGTLNNSGGNLETARVGTGVVTINSGTINQTSNNIIVGQGTASNATFNANGGLVD
ncbi:MAG: LEPR-XLL domain-containing protein, partial [Verrucomicrobiota bacterium]